MQKQLKGITDMAFLKNFQAVSVKPLLAEALKTKTAQAEQAACYRELFSEYSALCEMTGATPQSPALSAKALAWLGDEIARLEAQAIQDAERAYIADCVDDVLTDMGDELLGRREVQKRNGRRFKNELYSFDEGTAVNVTYSEDGKITMELGGLDYADREPDAAETARLCAEMENFCRDFVAIEERLAARGVTVKQRAAEYPATAEHAFIINFNDYETNGGKAPAAFKAQSDVQTAKPRVIRRDLP